MRLIFGLFCCLGASLVLKTVDAVHYDMSYLQSECSSNKTITPGQNGRSLYGFLSASQRKCYESNKDCSLTLIAKPGHQVAIRFQRMSINCRTDTLNITVDTKWNTYCGSKAPPSSIDSSSNWINLRFLTGRSYCADGFRLYYTSYHYGECSENEFRCLLDGRCIPNELKCDHNDNCGDWSDEVNGTCGVRSTSTVTAVTPPVTANPVYDHSYIQAPCDNSREFTLGANGFKRYGIIEANDDRYYNPFSNCSIRLSVRSGYTILLGFKRIAIGKFDVLTVTGSRQTRHISGNLTPAFWTDSTSNWLNIQFVTSANEDNKLGGFRLHYTYFHYGECSENEFRCSLGGHCLPNEVKCDQNDNCGDWTDEWTATCGDALSTTTVTAVTPPVPANPVYDHRYIQAPCDNSREFTLGANGYQRYGFIEANDDRYYNPFSNCSIRLSARSGYKILLGFKRIAIEIFDELIITGSVKTHRIEGYVTPTDSIYSTSNWLNIQFVTSPNIDNKLGGFRLYYTSFHYGQCSGNEFRCSLDGRCIPNEVVCDSYDNCGDSSDESSAACGGLSTSTVTPTDSANPVYDHRYIQAPCDSSRNFTLGANGFRRYGYIEADDDGCYNPYTDCRIQLSASSGYYITLRLQSINIDLSDGLIITGSAKTHRINGHFTPSNSIYSTSNWMNIQFVTTTSIYHCMGGFRLYYTSFHYGECSENEFRCSLDGRCIPNEVVCDSYDNCGDWSDEWAGTCGGLTTGAIVAISVTCAVVGIALFAFLIHCINRRKHRHSSSSSSSSSSSESVERRRSNPARHAVRRPPHQTEPLGFVEPIGPPKYIYAPPAYSNINSIYEDPDQIHPPPYQSTFTTTQCTNSNSNTESLTCSNDNTALLNSHEGNSNRADRGNSNDAVHF